MRLVGDADALNVTALAGTATANTSPLAVVGIGNVSGAVTVALDADVRVDTFKSGFWMLLMFTLRLRTRLVLRLRPTRRLMVLWSLRCQGASTSRLRQTGR